MQCLPKNQEEQEALKKFAEAELLLKNKLEESLQRHAKQQAHTVKLRQDIAKLMSSN